MSSSPGPVPTPSAMPQQMTWAYRNRLSHVMEPPPLDAVVVRGGLMALSDLANACEQAEAELGRPGLSVYVTHDAGDVINRLTTYYRKVRLSTVRKLSEAGFAVEQTGQILTHHTIWLRDGEERPAQLSAIVDCFDEAVEIVNLTSAVEGTK